MTLSHHFHSDIIDVLIIGGGLAGLFCALKLAPLPVTILTAAGVGIDTASNWAQGGIAAALSEGDSPERHTEDTCLAGAGISDPDRVLRMATEAQERVHDLLAYGVPFDQDLKGRLVQSQEAAHSHRRIVRVHGDQAGPAIMAALTRQVQETPSIHTIDHCRVESLYRHPSGFLVLHAFSQGQSHFFCARRVIMATGGIGQLFATTTNPKQAQGLGLSLAAKLGGVIANAEFVQFHPTAMDIGRDPAPLLTEALRGEGASIIDETGHRFLVDIHPSAELAPTDIVARAVFDTLASGKKVYLDARTFPGPGFPSLFPKIYNICKTERIDPLTTPIPIRPAEHYHMGGIWTDERGRTSVAQLWAIGEVACTGVHGANRLASNSLLEAVVFAHRVAEDIRVEIMSSTSEELTSVSDTFWQSFQDVGSAEDDLSIDLLRQHMSHYVGVCRHRQGLVEMLKYIAQEIISCSNLHKENMLLSALLITASAYQREESRGSHYRTDYPHPLPIYAQPSLITLKEVLTLAQNISQLSLPAHLFHLY